MHDATGIHVDNKQMVFGRKQSGRRLLGLMDTVIVYVTWIIRM